MKTDMKPLILTRTGRHIDLLHFRAEDLDIQDIAHALYFGGHHC